MIVRSFLLLLLFAGPLMASELSTPMKKSGRTPGQSMAVHVGETVSATIALNQINRIVLPFDRPEIRTLNPSTAEVQGHVLYIAPIDPAKIYLYVTNAEDPDAAIALSLTPQEIPPQEWTLEFAPDPAPSAPKTRPEPSQRAGEHPESGDHTREILKTLALGQIPDGYRFREPAGGEAIRCQQKHALIRTRQVFYSPGTQVRVGVIKNNGKLPLQLEEETCMSSAAIHAVATYPSGPLSPGQEAEIYIVVFPEDQSPSRPRPPLLARKS